VSRAGRREPVRRRELRSGEQAHGPQHEVKPAASKDEQSGSRAAHVTAKATPEVRAPERTTGPGGVRGAARVQGEVRNTRDPSQQPQSRQGGSYKPKAKASAAERESEGTVVVMMAATNNATGAKGPCGGQVGGAGKREGMAATSGPNDPGARRARDKVRRLQRRLCAAAKRQPGRRFHALYDHIGRSDVLLEAWRRVRSNKGAAGVDAMTIVEVEQYGVVVTDGEGRITGFQEKPAKGTERSHLANTGIYALAPDIFEEIPAAQFYDFGKQVFPAFQQRNAAFYGFDAGGAYWSDIGTPSEYRRASFDVVNGVFRIAESHGSGIAATALVSCDARIEGNVWIGEAARVDAGAYIVGPCVLGDGTHIGADATVERSILWDRASVGERARIAGCIIGIDYSVAPNTSLTGAILANDAPLMSR